MTSFYIFLIILLFCFFILLYIFYLHLLKKKYKIDPVLSFEATEVHPNKSLFDYEKLRLDLLVAIDQFYIKSFYRVFIKLFIYLLLTVFIFLSIRLAYLGVNRQLDTFRIQEHYFNYKFYFIIVLLVLIYLYFMKIVNIILYPTILQLHFYLQGNERYIAIEDWYKHNYFGYILESIVVRISVYISPIFYKEIKFSQLCLFLTENKVKYEMRLYSVWWNVLRIKIMRKLRKYPKILSFLRIIDGYTTSRYIWLRITDFFFFIPHLLVLFTFLYDIHIHGNFYYIYFALLNLFLTNISKNIREFMYLRDPLLDHHIYTSLYEVEHYNKIHLLLEKWKNSDKNSDLYEEINLQLFFDNLTSKEPLGNEHTGYMFDNEEMLEYFKNDLKIYYARESDSRSETFRERRARVKRFIIQGVCLIFNIYLIYNSSTYILRFHEIYLPIEVLALPLVIMYIVNPSISEDAEEFGRYIYYNRYKFIFYVCFLIELIMIFVIMVKNKVALYPDPILWDNVLVLQEIFSENQKIEFITKYFKYLLKVNKLNMLDYSLINPMDLNWYIPKIKEYIQDWVVEYKLKIYRIDITMEAAFISEENNKLPAWITQIRKFGTICYGTWFVGSVLVTIPVFIDVWYNPEQVVINIIKNIFKP